MSTQKKPKIRSLKEQFAKELGFDNQSESLKSRNLASSLFQPWDNQPYSELMAIAAMLRAINTLNHSFHWKASGDSFYGDHLLFQRIYEGVLPDIDALGEKAIGFGDGQLSNPLKLIQAEKAFLTSVLTNDSIVNGAKNDADRMFRRAGYAESLFIETTEAFMKDLESKGLLTKGIDNLLAGVLDTHEGYLYLLKQRTKQDY